MRPPPANGFPSESLRAALDAAHALGASKGANLTQMRLLLLAAFRRSRLRQIAQRYTSIYRAADPFPHMAIDGLVPNAILQLVSVELPEEYGKGNGCVRGAQFCISGRKSHVHRRSQIDKERHMKPHTIMLFRALKSNEFRNFLERVSGISPLYSDPLYAGAGAHFAAPGSRLDLHSDFNMEYGMHRRVNTFLYLNEDWREEYGGHLQLWDRNMTTCVQRILPTWSRFVAFSSTDFTWHGHPDALSCPPNRMRRAIVLYYFGKGRPREECAFPDDCDRQHNTMWVKPKADAVCARRDDQVEDAIVAKGIQLRGSPTKRMPAIGFGTCCRKSALGPPLIKSTKSYLAQGGRMIDTAQLYQNHKDLRVAIEESGVPRKEIWVLSKLNTRPDKDAIHNRADADRAIDNTLSELGLQYIDALLIHGTSPS